MPAIAAALVTIHSIAWKTAQHFSYGARGFMRVPVSEANDLNFLLGVNDKIANPHPTYINLLHSVIESAISTNVALAKYVANIQENCGKL